jgi:hypothetical protein
MTLKQEVSKAGHKLSHNITLYARNKYSNEIYSIINVSDGIATLRSEYNAKKVPSIKLEELYKDYLGIHEEGSNSFTI